MTEFCKYAEPQMIRMEAIEPLPGLEGSPAGIICYAVPRLEEPLSSKERRAFRKHVTSLHERKQAEILAIIKRRVSWPWCGFQEAPVDISWGKDPDQGLIVPGFVCRPCQAVKKALPKEPKPAPVPPAPEVTFPEPSKCCICKISDATGQRNSEPYCTPCREHYDSEQKKLDEFDQKHRELCAAEALRKYEGVEYKHIPDRALCGLRDLLKRVDTDQSKRCLPNINEELSRRAGYAKEQSLVVTSTPAGRISKEAQDHIQSMLRRMPTYGEKVNTKAAAIMDVLGDLNDLPDQSLMVMLQAQRLEHAKTGLPHHDAVVQKLEEELKKRR
jgi:hypothetical protein